MELGIKSFPTTYSSWRYAEEKLHFTPVHTLRQLKRDEALFPPLPISLADRNGLKNLPRQMFSACVKFGGNPCRDVDTLRFYTHTHPMILKKVAVFFVAGHFGQLKSLPAEYAHINRTTCTLACVLKYNEIIKVC